MGIVRKQGFWSSIYTYFGIALGFVNMVWLFPSILNSDNFGLLRVIIASSMLISKFGEFGLSSTVNKFFSYFRNNEKSHFGFLTFVLGLASSLNLLLILLLLIFKDLLFNLFGNSETLISENFLFIVLISISLTFNEIFAAYSRSNQRAIFPAFAKETFLRLLQLVSILMFSLKQIEFVTFLALFSSTYLIQTILLLAFLKFRNLLVIPYRVAISEVLYYKEILLYSFFMFLNKLPAMTLNQIDVLMLGALAGLTDAGKYFIAFSIAEVIKVPARNIVQISTPIIADAWRRKDYGKISKMYYQSSINQLLIGGLFLSLILVNLNDLIFFLEKEYQGLYVVVLLVGLSKLFDMATGINGIIINTSRYYKYSLYFNLVLLILAVITNYLFIPKYGINGAAFATALSIFLLNSIKYVFVWIKMKMQPFKRNTLSGLTLIVVVFVLGEIVPTPDIILLNIFIRSVVIGSVFLAAVYYLNISDELKETVLTVLNRLKKIL